MNFVKVCELAERFEKQAIERDIEKLAKKRKGKKWKKLPKGWTAKSRKKHWESLVGKTKHPVTKCIEEMKDHVDDPGAYCASLADREKPGWREESARKRRKKKKEKKKS